MIRQEIENRMARAISSGMRRAYNQLLEYLGDPPNLDNVPHEYWQNGWRDIQKQVEPILIETFTGAASDKMIELSFGVDWDLVNEDAANWSRRHLEALLSDMFQKRYAHVSENVARFFEEGWTSQDLAKRLETWYSPVRAEMIAITETTRAAVEGERMVVAQLEKQAGIRMVPIWLTANDEDRVCVFCRPRNGKVIEDGIYPPAHPRCRCGVAHELREVAE